MRLKSLEIKGFKSFANETLINFNADVIGIVGPNGSGKSNIVDAIRWVLGEQSSRELRLDQMTSVIFNGAKKRKAAGLAQVSLTFENTKNLLPTEYQTVSITRMLYRTGESEYRLNGVPCRLKDITSLFLDTGIGSNSYAIIALGMVDDILADKDNSRRRMFEQAAGVSKYKIRKKETLNKLKSTSEDLDRVEDLLYEINTNLVSLEKQAKRAKKYLELKAEYKALSIDMAVLKISMVKERQQTLGAQLEQQEDAFRQHEVLIHQLESKLESEKKENLDKEKALSDRQRDLNQLIGQIRGLENDKQILQQKENFIRQNKEKLNSDIASAKKRIELFEADIEQFRSDLHLEKRIEARFEQELIQAEEGLEQIKVSHGSIKSELEGIVSRQQGLERELFELEKQKAVNLNQSANYTQEIERSELAVQLRGEEAGGFQERLAELQKALDAKTAELAELEQAEEKRQQDLQTTEAAVEDLNGKISKLNRELDAKRNEFKLTQSMIENLEGFPESIRFLSGSKEWKKETPLLSDIIYVNEAYRVAIENYLEPYLNYYVVQNLEEAANAIQLLGKSQKGKANFFMLDAFRDYSAPMRLLPDTVQAIDMVQTEPAYFNLVSYLLENVLVTQNDELAASSLEEGVVLLAQSGRFIKRRYSISGGSVGLFEGKRIGRKKNLEVLDNAIKKGEREANRLSTEYYNLRNRLEGLKAQRTHSQIQQKRHELNQIEQQRVSVATRLESYDHFVAEEQAKQNRFREMIVELEKQNRTIETGLNGKNGEIAAVKEQIANMDGSYRDAAEQLSRASTAYNEKNIEFIRQQNKVTAIQREMNFRERQLEETRHTLENNQKNLIDSDGEIIGIQETIDKFEQQLQTAYQDRKTREALLTEAEQGYFQARGGINEMEDELRKVNRLRQDAQILVNQLKEKRQDLKFEVSSIAERLRIEFNIQINDIINSHPVPAENLDELEIKVGRVRSRIEGYGEINPMAVEAYDEMKERFDSISKQRDDIRQAKESLLETIKEIEETATIQFLEAFEKARLYFIDVFRSLFTEDDNCDLILLEPENPLESKIEIVAKPKGKRPQTISQLSGGEKTLTATALLFSLYLLKPAPFCIFDEVDAPLDDANIYKFNRIIKKFSTDSQFIIVTHNKLTMAAVDTIYGVYMAEQGVSGVSPVDFRDFEHTASFEVSQN